MCFAAVNDALLQLLRNKGMKLSPQKKLDSFALITSQYKINVNKYSYDTKSREFNQFHQS